jgi:hypothetical protein
MNLVVAFVGGSRVEGLIHVFDLRRTTFPMIPHHGTT